MRGDQRLSSSAVLLSGPRDDEGLSSSVLLTGPIRMPRLIMANETPKHVDLSSVSLGAEGARMLAEALRRNTSIVSLDLSSNNLDAEGASVLAEALRSNTSIVSIDVSSNNVGSEGASALAVALKVFIAKEERRTTRTQKLTHAYTHHTHACTHATLTHTGHIHRTQCASSFLHLTTGLT
jgi:hypothetical protein